MKVARPRTRRSAPSVVLLDGDNTQLANLCGPLDENLRQVAAAFDVEVSRRGSRVSISGERADEAAVAINFLHIRSRHHPLSIDDVQLSLVELQSMQNTGKPAQPLPEEARPAPASPADESIEGDTIVLRTRRTDLRP